MNGRLLRAVVSPDGQTAVVEIVAKHYDLTENGDATVGRVSIGLEDGTTIRVTRLDEAVAGPVNVRVT